jgi:hypothetical protein
MACAMVQLSSGNCDCFQTLFLLHEKTIPCIACTDIWFDISLYSFDQFHIIRQGLLLSIDTFGVSNILPVLSLPFIALVWCNTGSKDNKAKGSIINSLTHSGGAPGVANCGRRHTSRRKTHTLGTVAHCSDTVSHCSFTVFTVAHISVLSRPPLLLTQVHKVKENSVFSSECWCCTTTKYTIYIEYYLFYAELKYTSSNTGPYWIID